MYLPDILTAPVQPAGPADPARPGQAETAVWVLHDDGDVQIGVWQCTPGTYDRQPNEYDEMMFIAAGRATVTDADGSYDLVPGTMLVTPREWARTWTVHQTVRKLFVIDKRAGGVAPLEFLSNAYDWPVGEHKPHPKPLAGSPDQILRELWVHNGLEVGVWECDPGSFGISRDGFDEVMVILAGKATMNATNNHVFALHAGSVLHTPQGFVGHWIIDEPLRKVYVKVMR